MISHLIDTLLIPAASNIHLSYKQVRKPSPLFYKHDWAGKLPRSAQICSMSYIYLCQTQQYTIMNLSYHLFSTYLIQAINTCLSAVSQSQILLESQNRFMLLSVARINFFH